MFRTDSVYCRVQQAVSLLSHHARDEFQIPDHLNEQRIIIIFYAKVTVFGRTIQVKGHSH